MFRIVPVVALILTVAGLADAACVQPIRRFVHQDQVQLVAAQQILLPSYTPVFGGYDRQSLESDVLRQILDELRAIREELGAKGAAGLSLEQVALSDCRRCHDAKSAKLAGGGFVLIDDDGKLAPLSLTDKKLVALRVSSADPKQRMPPDRELTNAKRQAIVAGLK